MQRAASNIRTEANVLKDTVDGDGVAELAAQSAAERPIGDLSPEQLLRKFRETLYNLEMGALLLYRNLDQRNYGAAMVNAEEHHAAIRAAIREVRQ